MLHDRQTFRLVEKLLLLTHLAIRAVEEAEYEELQALLERRGEVVDDLAGCELDPESATLYHRVELAERTLTRRLKGEMEDSVRHLHGLYMERRGHKAYRAA